MTVLQANDIIRPRRLFMTDLENEPLFDNEILDTPKEDSNGRLSNLWERISRFGIAGSVLKIGSHVITILVVIIMVLALSNFFIGNLEDKNTADMQATAMAIAQPTMDAAAGLTEDEAQLGIISPPFLETEKSLENSISRLAEPNTIIPSRPRAEITIHEVDQGQSLFSIADIYGLMPETILWGNYATLKDNPRTISIGQELNILPVDGTLHQYSAGESLSAIASFFETEVEKIISFSGNNLDPYEIDIENPAIADGTLLIIPDGQREVQDWGPPAITRENPAAAKYYGAGYCGEIYEGAVGTYNFLWPTNYAWLSGYDYNSNIHPAIDIGGVLGDPIYATDTGVVVYAGWSDYGYGWLVVIDHGTGWQSAYAHLNGYSVNCGQSVYQGDVIAALGSSGQSSGPHLHFELSSSSYGKVNPWNYLISP